MEHVRIRLSPDQSGHGLADRADDLRERLNSALRIVDQVAGVPVLQLPNEATTEADVRAILRSRRNRDRFFDGGLFADPAWDILLELYAAELGQQRKSIGSLCSGAAVPATTALRWIGVLEKKRLIERKADPMDGRRFYVSLSGSGLEAMTAYFRTVACGTSFI